VAWAKDRIKYNNPSPNVPTLHLGLLPSLTIAGMSWKVARGSQFNVLQYGTSISPYSSTQFFPITGVCLSAASVGGDLKLTTSLLANCSTPVPLVFNNGVQLTSGTSFSSASCQMTFQITTPYIHQWSAFGTGTYPSYIYSCPSPLSCNFTWTIFSGSTGTSSLTLSPFRPSSLGSSFVISVTFPTSGCGAAVTPTPSVGPIPSGSFSCPADPLVVCSQNQVCQATYNYVTRSFNSGSLCTSSIACSDSSSISVSGSQTHTCCLGVGAALSNCTAVPAGYFNCDTSSTGSRLCDPTVYACQKTIFFSSVSVNYFGCVSACSGSLSGTTQFCCENPIPNITMLNPSITGAVARCDLNITPPNTSYCRTGISQALCNTVTQACESTYNWNTATFTGLGCFAKSTCTAGYNGITRIETCCNFQGCCGGSCPAAPRSSVTLKLSLLLVAFGVLASVM